VKNAGIPLGEGGRLHQLDALRGLAALVVVFRHSFDVVTHLPSALEESPLYLLVGGHEAVIFFFILSGFVLSLPFYSGKEFSYFSYMVKRAVRIYLPFMAAMIAAMMMCQMLYQGGITHLSAWMSNKWSIEVTFNTILEQLNILGNHETRTYNPVVWSLIHEMRISLIFPLLMIIINRFNWKVPVAIAAACSLIGGLNGIYGLEPSLGYQTSWFDSIHFTAMFIIGALAAKHRRVLLDTIAGMRKLNKLLILATGFVAYIYSREMKTSSMYFADAAADWGISFGVVTIIIFALGDRAYSQLLGNKVVTFVGKISFSLYLYHTTVMFTFLHLLHNQLNPWLILALSLPPIMLVSYSAWKWVERPSITLGKSLTRSQEKSVFKAGGVRHVS
jgi:peptidoglycan/LPS O-acetylase OafA/YrhL